MLMCLSIHFHLANATPPQILIRPPIIDPFLLALLVVGLAE
jgi:hypothetical protein